MPFRLLPAVLLLCVVLGRAASLPPEAYPGLRSSDGSLVPAITAHLGREVRIIERRLDPDLLQRRANFGYTEEEIQTYFSRPVTMVLDETGLDRSFLKPPPPPGVHPRVLFNPEDLPGLRARLADTQAGRAAMSGIRSHLLATMTGPQARFRDQYEALVSGELPPSIDVNVSFSLMYEAFRCLIEEDQEGGRRIAAAITTFSRQTSAELAAARANPRNAGSLDDARIISQGPSREFTLGLCYDFAHGFMNETQREEVRAVLVDVTSGMTGIGAETLHALHAGASNWVSWGARFLFAICAIEGEPGYDPAAFQRFANAQINFINTLYASGESFEGWGKNFMFLEHLVILAKRGEHLNILGHTHLRAAFNQYFVAALNPWGDGFTFYDSMARSGGKIPRNADVLAYRTLFPDDPAGRFLYRHQISGDYANVGARALNTRHPFSTMDALVCAIFAADLDPVGRDEEFARVTRDRPLTYFGEDTGNLVTRTAWAPDAVYLGYLNRSVPGGHQYADRGHFNLYSHGRFWSIYQVSRQVREQYGPIMRSVLMVDGEGPSVAEGRCIGFLDTPLATLVASDFSQAWNFQTRAHVPPPPGVELGPKLLPYNHFRLRPSPIPWMNMPIGQLPDWYTSAKPSGPGFGNNSRADWYRRHEVRKAFRSIALVRGSRPYALVVDDLQLDERSRRFVWGMTLAPDVEWLGARVLSAEPGLASADVLLRESDKPDLRNAIPSEKNRRLLVRVLSASHLAGPPTSLEKVSVRNSPQPDLVLNRLHLASESADPSFKILLFPHVEGDPLPQTSWNAARATVTVRWPDQTDHLSFVAGPDGRTRVQIRREGGETVRFL